jgi:hypothetical protein
MDPTTREMAANGPMPRMNSDGGEDVGGGAFAGAAMEYPDVDKAVVLSEAKRLPRASRRDLSDRTRRDPTVAMLLQSLP